MGVAPDFEATARSGTRTAATATWTFISSATPNRAAVGNCRFRVTGRRPECWDAITGRRRDLPQFTEADGVTTVPLEFAPVQSCFVVFRKPSAQITAEDAKNFPRQSRWPSSPGLGTCPSIQVGRPGEVCFEKLEDWTKRPEAGIRNYSGTATYRRVFDLDAERLARTSRECYLDVGDVQVMARVRLNGRDLGVVWSIRGESRFRRGFCGTAAMNWKSVWPTYGSTA